MPPELTRYLVVPRAIKAISSSSSGCTTKVPNTGIPDVKLSELHDKLHTSEEIAPQLRGLCLHDHHSYRPAIFQFPVPETPIAEYLKNKEQRDSRARDLECREVHDRLRGVYNQSLKSPPPFKKVRVGNGDVYNFTCMPLRLLIMIIATFSITCCSFDCCRSRWQRH
jgi:hypothetical protein